MELFKFCKSEHWLLMNSSGGARLGALEDYRANSKYGELTSDPHDGAVSYSGTLHNLTASSLAAHPALTSGVIHMGPHGQIGELVINNLVHRAYGCLIFSASKSYSLSAHERWASEEQYDCCYRIKSHTEFFHAISQALGPNYRFLGSADIFYTDVMDLSTPEAAINPVFVKRRTGYFGQNEHRAVWVPVRHMENVDPVIIEKSGAKEYCEHLISI